MGVRQTTYVMVGVAFRNKDEKDYIRSFADDDGMDRFQEPHSPVTVIVDYMGGDYVAVGKILATSDEYDGIDFTEIGIGLLDNYYNEVRDWIVQQFPELPLSIPRLLVFTDYY